MVLGSHFIRLVIKDELFLAVFAEHIVRIEVHGPLTQLSHVVTVDAMVQVGEVSVLGGIFVFLHDFSVFGGQAFPFAFLFAIADVGIRRVADTEGMVFVRLVVEADFPFEVHFPFSVLSRVGSGFSIQQKYSWFVWCCPLNEWCRS